MSSAQYAALLSAALGAAGTGFLYRGTYGFEPYEGATFGSPEQQQRNSFIYAKNKSRQRSQRIGIVLLFLSFALQAVVVFLI